MPSASTFHVTATESRTLCGSSASAPRAQHLPWDDWSMKYAEDRVQCCVECRRIAMQYADRAKELRTTDKLYYPRPDLFSPEP